MGKRASSDDETKRSEDWTQYCPRIVGSIYILSEFDVKAFGVESKAYQKHEISDKTIRRMKNQRKKKFADLKIAKV